MRTFYRTLRIFAAVTLFFFCWTYMPIYAAVAYAAGPKKGRRGDAVTERQTQKNEARPEERFEKALEEIREKAGKAEEKAGRRETATEEIAAIKAKKAEIESLDVEFKKEFAATEKKLKDAKLPQEILNRHYKFVKHYEDNLNELKTNLVGLEKAQETQDKVKEKEYIGKIKNHLERTKPPKKHVPLDPNKLPFRTVKAKEQAPRLKKEEFEKDFPPQRSPRPLRTASINGVNSELRTPNSGLIRATDEHGLTRIETNWMEVAAGFSLRDGKTANLSRTISPSPVLLAYNDIASDIPSSLGVDLTSNSELNTSNWDFSASPRLLVSESDPLMLAQALDAPTAADLAETPDVQFSQDIRDLATQLNNNPVKIFEWVKNNIEFVPTYGSIQGADMCLQSRQCNDMDTASLLISLLRVSNIPAHYVYGTIEVPIDKAMNWIGGFTNPRSALAFITSGGIPAAGKLTGGAISAIRMEHAWVEAYIPYGNYRGAIMDQSIKTWIPLDGSYKQYTYTNGFDITATVPFNQDEYMSQVRSQNAIHYYQSKIQQYLDANMPDTSIEDVIGYRAITRESYHFLPSTLPYVVAQLNKFSTIPDGMTAKLTFTLSNPASGSAVSYTATTAEFAGKRLTISYDPATPDDDAIINNYGGYIYGVPAYVLNLKPVIKVNGAITLTGEAVTMGSAETLTIQFSQPASNLNETVQKKIVSGTYYAVGLDLQGTNVNVVGKRNNALTSNALSESAGTLGRDGFIGEYLYVRALMYFFANDKIYKAGSKLYNTAITRTISEAITSFPLTVSQLFGVAKSVAPAGVEMDVAMDRIITIAKDGDTAKEKSYMDIAGLVSSYNEHSLFENIDGYASVSAVKALQVASANGIPIQHINASNIGQLLPALEVTEELKSDIQNAVNAGKEITIPQTDIQINDWIGVGYIVKDPNTGSGAYMISGGLGGAVSVAIETGKKVATAFVSVVTWVWDMLSYAFGGSVAYAAEILIYTDDIGEAIAEFASRPPIFGSKYVNGVSDCSFLVRMAYAMAGLCIDYNNVVRGIDCANNNLADKYNFKWSGDNGATWLYQLANSAEISPYGGIVESVDKNRGIPNRGDMVFFDYGTTDGYNHVGIVVGTPDGNETIIFVDTTQSSGADINNMNLTYKTDSRYNTDLRGYKKDANGEYLRDANGKKIPYEHRYAGDLFAGFGTVRNLGHK